MNPQSVMELAVRAVGEAAALCRAVQASLDQGGTAAKEDRSPVTVADLGVQALITSALTAELPEIPIVGEEDTAVLNGPTGSALRDRVVGEVRRIRPDLDEGRVLAAIDRGSFAGGPRGRHWALDPIDGTKGFLRRDQYATALALIEDGRVVLGVLGCPSLPWSGDGADDASGCLFSALKGQGAFVQRFDGGDRARIRVTEIEDPAEATFCESVEKGHTAQGDSARVAETLGVTRPPYRIDSQCKYAAIARGDSSIYLRMPTRADYEERIWDHAAGSIVVEEAGGRVTDIHGRPLDFSLGRTLRDNKGVVATNGRLHDRVIRAIAEVIG